MKTMFRRLIAGVVITILASAFSGCSPVFMASARPRPVIYSAPPPAPAVEPVYASTFPVVQPAVVTPVVPVWAPPYTYVNEVHYYYFPDYMVYYDVFAQNYWYFDGYSWVHVVTLPSIPVFVGFNPCNSYIVVLNRTTRNPWMRHEYFEQQYPRNYYSRMYAPRHELGSNTVLRAYDENQRRPLFVDKHSNKEVTVKYEVRNIPRSTMASNAVPVQPVTPPSRSNNNTTFQSPRTDISSNTDLRNDSREKSNNELSKPADRRDNVTMNHTNINANNPISENPRANSYLQNPRGNSSIQMSSPSEIKTRPKEISNNSVRTPGVIQPSRVKTESRNNTLSSTSRSDQINAYHTLTSDNKQLKNESPEKRSMRK